MWKTIEIDVDLSDFDDEDLIETLEDRGYVVNKTTISFGRTSEEGDPIQKIYQAMKFGKPYDELVRKFVMDHTGRIL
jgi:hypothetical protein